MPHRTVIVALAGLALLPLIASAQNACSAQVVPTEPSALLTCSNAAPICVTDANGLHGYWAWICPGKSNAGPKFIDPSVITNSVTTPAPGDSVIDIARRIYQLRQLQLQNQQVLEQTRQLAEERKKAEEQAPLMLSFRSLLGEHFEVSGLEKLSPEELARLDVWITAYKTELVRLTKVQAIQEASAK